MLVLKPTSTKPTNPSRPPKPPSSNVDKRPLAQSMLILLQHAHDLFCSSPVPSSQQQQQTSPSSSSAIIDILASTIRTHPWLWEFFIRRHFQDFLSLPGAAFFLIQALDRQDPLIVARGWASLAMQLHAHASKGDRQAAMEALVSHPSAAVLRQAALTHISACFHLVSRDMLLDGGSVASTTTNPTIPASSEVHVIPTLILPTSLFVALLLTLGHPTGTSTTTITCPSDPSILKGVLTYTSTLLSQLGNPEAVHRMLRLESLTHARQEQQRESKKDSGGSGGSDDTNNNNRKNGDSESDRLRMDEVHRIHAVMSCASVLIEAVLTWHQISPDPIQPPPKEEKVKDNKKSDGNRELPLVSSLLALRWELSHLLYAASIPLSLSRSLLKTIPPPGLCARVMCWWRGRCWVTRVSYKYLQPWLRMH